MSTDTTYRTCPRSGLQFEQQAEWLMRANAFVGVVFLLVGGGPVATGKLGGLLHAGATVRVVAPAAQVHPREPPPADPPVNHR